MSGCDAVSSANHYPPEETSAAGNGRTVSSEKALSQRKHGRLVAHILATFVANPDAALTVADIAMPAYGVELRRVTKAHRVAVLRAMRRVCELEPRFGLMNGEGPQGQMVIHDRTWPLSYGLARLKADWMCHYQWEMPRWVQQGDSEEQLKAQLAPGGYYHQYVQPGGAWWLHAQSALAALAGDHKAVARLKMEQEALLAALFDKPPATVSPASNPNGLDRPGSPL